MSGIDTSIYQNMLRPVKSVQDYDNEAMLGQQNRLNLQMQQQKADEYSRGISDSNQLRDVVKGFGDDTDANQKALLGAGRLTEATAYAKSATEQKRATLEASKAELENGMKQYEAMAQLMSGVKDPLSYDVARQQAVQILGPKAAANIPPVYDPVEIERGRLRAMPIKEQMLNHWKDIESQLAANKFGEDKRHNRAGEGATIRGQNMTASTAAAGREQSMSKPFEVTGQDGMPVLVRQDRDGNISPVEGYAPKMAMQKPLAPGVVKTLTEARDNAATMDRLNTEFKDEYGGKGLFGIGADVSMAVKGNTGTDQNSVAFWKDYKKNAELVERHAMFGASLTPGEQASWRSADVAPGMSPAVIKTNLATRAALTKKMAAATTDDMVDAGHSEGRVRAIAGRGEKSPPSAPARVKNAADYAKVPSGTEYMSPDGQLRRKP